MALEVGQIVEGKVSGITGFGAFIDLPDGETGLVHISEISKSFVKENLFQIGDKFLKVSTFQLFLVVLQIDLQTLLKIMDLQNKNVMNISNWQIYKTNIIIY